MTTGKKHTANIHALVEKSSLGDREARLARSRVSTETARMVVQRSASGRAKNSSPKSGG